MSSTEPPPPESEAGAKDSPSSSPSRTQTLYNTFLSPSGSTSFFTTHWFESRPVRDGSGRKGGAGAGGGEASTSSSSSSSSSSPPASRRRRPSYEEYRSQEPPQARLIRLRGLFDVLMDKDQRDALADGRAKEAWRATAGVARYGAGGNLARGSLAKEMHLDREMDGKEFELNADNTRGGGGDGDAATAAAASKSKSSSSTAPPALPSPPRQSYAKELLTQCRQCRMDSGGGGGGEGNQDASASASTSSSSWLSHLWPGSATSSSSNASSSPSSSSSSWYSISGSSQAGNDGESGYAGSGVWGLSAVSGRRRDEDDSNRDSSASSSSSLRSSSSPPSTSSASPPSPSPSSTTHIEWEGFLRYAELKERELYKIFTELDRNCDMRLDVAEIRTALDKAGIDLPPALLDDFIASLSSSTRSADPHQRASRGEDDPCFSTPTYISWPEFRDYLLLLPRKPSVGEIFKFYQVRKAFGLFGIGGVFSEFGRGWGSDRHGATAVTSDGDVSFGADASGGAASSASASASAGDAGKKATREAIVAAETAKDGREARDILRNANDGDGEGGDARNVVGSGESSLNDGDGGEEDADADADAESDPSAMIHSDVALKFLLAGGIAGAVSRTATAPFDRLKIYLITASRSEETATRAAANALKSAPSTGAAAADAGKIASRSMGLLATAIQTLYRDGGGLKAFWLGNGLNCIKIFPESAIKFLSYETSKRAFAKYVDHVQDPRDISGTSRFVSGGIGGITSQLAIYPVETLKTRLMSSQGGGQKLAGNALLFATAKDMWKAGGLRVYYRGLVAGLVGVFPYSAIDMSTFEGIKLAYISYTGKEDPGTLALLAFGSVSGSVGASTVYPLNLIRTRLQAAGTPAHPQTYAGFVDAVKKTYAREGFVGFYRGLVPTLAKVVPAVSISYVCYENSKKRLGVA